MNEPELIKQICAGDDAAYAQLIERYQRGLVRYCFTIVHDADAAEDIAQEAFIAAYDQLAKYQPEHSFSTWLYRIAHNKAINSLRRPEAVPLDTDAPIPHTDTTREAIEREDREAAVRRAVDRLPVNHRTVIHLHYWEHRPYHEIATVMGVPATTIKTWLFRARQQLKEDCHGIIG